MAVYALVWLAFGVRYEVNDDATLCNIAAGAYGEDSQYLVYINILIGYFLKPFYCVLPGGNWLYFCRRRRSGSPCGFVPDAFGKVRPKTGNRAQRFAAGAGRCGLFYSFQYVKNSGLYLVVGLALMGGSPGALGQREPFGNLFGAAGFHGTLSKFPGGGRNGRRTASGAFCAGPGWKEAGGRRHADDVLFGGTGQKAWTRWLIVCRKTGRLIRNTMRPRTEVSDFRLQYVQSSQEMEAYGYSANDYDTLNSWSFGMIMCSARRRLRNWRRNCRKMALSALRDAGHYCLGVLDNAPFHLLLCCVVLAWLFYGRKRTSWAFCGHGNSLWLHGILPVAARALPSPGGIRACAGGRCVCRAVLRLEHKRERNAFRCGC